MNENSAQKVRIVDSVREQFEAADFTVLVEYRGVNVASMSALRRTAREADVRIRIVKNTLARRAVEDTRFECLAEHMHGPLALVTGKDAASVAKTVHDFAAEVEHFKICVAALEGDVLSAEQVAKIAKLPSREQLCAQLAGVLAAPLTKLAATLNQLPAGLVRALAAVRDAKDG